MVSTTDPDPHPLDAVDDDVFDDDDDGLGAHGFHVVEDETEEPVAVSYTHHRSASEVVRAALRLLEKEEREGPGHEPEPRLRRIEGGNHAE